jgi:hypothetical protein
MKKIAECIINFLGDLVYNIIILLYAIRYYIRKGE